MTSELFWELRVYQTFLIVKKPKKVIQCGMRSFNAWFENFWNLQLSKIVNWILFFKFQPWNHSGCVLNTFEPKKYFEHFFLTFWFVRTFFCSEFCGFFWIFWIWSEFVGIGGNCFESFGIGQNCSELFGIVSNRSGLFLIVRNYFESFGIGQNFIELFENFRNCSELSEIAWNSLNQFEIVQNRPKCTQNHF